MKLSFCSIALFLLPIALRGMDYTISRYKIDQGPSQKQSYQILALQNNSNILGYIKYSLDNQNCIDFINGRFVEKSHRIGLINGLFVEKPHRKKGIGAQLLFESCKHLKEEGCNRVSGMPYPLINSISSLLENTDLRAIAVLQSSRMLIGAYPRYLPSQLDSRWFDIGCNVATIGMWLKFSRSRVDFYKKFGAQQSPFSFYASYDLTQDTISTLEQKLKQRKVKAPAKL